MRERTLSEVQCDDHKCIFNDYALEGNLTPNSCQFKKVFIVNGKCSKYKLKAEAQRG